MPRVTLPELLHGRLGQQDVAFVSDDDVLSIDCCLLRQLLLELVDCHPFESYSLVCLGLLSLEEPLVVAHQVRIG